MKELIAAASESMGSGLWLNPTLETVGKEEDEGRTLRLTDGSGYGSIPDGDDVKWFPEELIGLAGFGKELWKGELGLDMFASACDGEFGVANVLDIV